MIEVIREKVGSLYHSKRFNLLAFGLIGVLVLIAYSNTFTASFHFDDNPSIVENPFIKRVTVDNILVLLQGHRPVVNMSLVLNYMLSGLNVVGWHIFNIAVHIADSMLVYLLILWTLNLPSLAAKFGEKSKRMALFGALLFAAHPVQTESVTYIISRSELLATFFYLCTFLLFIKGAGSKRSGYYIAAIVTSLLAMGSKEWAVTLPATLFLYDYLFLSDSKIKTVLSRGIAYLLVALPWIYIASSTDIIGSAANASYGFNMSTARGITPWSYLLTSCNVLWTYIRLLFLPINQNLDYDYPVASSLFAFPTVLSVLGHVAVIVLAFWLYKKKGWKLIPFGVAWFYITMSPVQSFVPIIDVIFEHRVYLPSIGFFLAFVAAYEGIFEWWEKRHSNERVLA